MGMPALQINRETLVDERMDQRVAVLETHIEHITTDIADLKIDVREMRREMIGGFAKINERMDNGFAAANERMDKGSAAANERMDKGFVAANERMDRGFAVANERMDKGFAAVNERMDNGFAETRAETAALRDSIDSAKFWALGLYAALTVAIFGVMARGFGWI